MKKIFSISMLSASILFTNVCQADDSARAEEVSARPFSIAVFGDWPYNQNLLNNAPLLINSINADR
ncbi:MAG TPA: hypothetical protein VFM46_04995, partial [Pseudomonadales bacterium]|nr:hypothetical protein [Pseudomonadales bacterium]